MIVVIGILAAISIVAYNGIQTRASNATQIQTAQQFYKLVSAAKISNPNMGLTIGSWARWCPSDTGDEMVSGNPRCGQYYGTTQASENTVSHNSTLINALKENSSSLPKIGKVSSGSTHFYGPILVTGRFADADNNQVNALLHYWLKGHDQDYTLPNQVSGFDYSATGLPANTDARLTASTTGYYSTDQWFTYCYSAVK